MGVKEYVVIKTVKEYFRIEANSKKEAEESLDNEDPYLVDVKSMKAFIFKDNKE